MPGELYGSSSTRPKLLPRAVMPLWQLDIYLVFELGLVRLVHLPPTRC